MGKFDRAELEQSFRRYWQTGAVGEDWDAWSNLFTPDALYVAGDRILVYMQNRRLGRRTGVDPGGEILVRAPRSSVPTLKGMIVPNRAAPA